jgi:thioredoxin-dependent peroxiredoxin
MLAERTPAPDFEAESEDGSTIRLAELRGRPVVLYFHPRDEPLGR